MFSRNHIILHANKWMRNFFPQEIPVPTEENVAEEKQKDEL